MKKCPNCGQMAERTEDWACQWCGYPLLSNSYTKISKTYRQLKGGKLDKQPLMEEDVVSPPLSRTVAPTPTPEPAPAPQTTVVEPEPAPVPEQVIRQQPEPVSAPEPIARPEPVLEPEPELVEEPEPVEELKPVVEPEPQPEPEPEPVSELVEEPEPEPAPQPRPAVAGGLTVEELYATYSADAAVADAKYTDKTLTVTGVVDRITVNDLHDIYYIILSGAEKREQWNVRCVFDRKSGAQLNRLTTGQTVTARGKYDGYKANILMKDCVLVS